MTPYKVQLFQKLTIQCVFASLNGPATVLQKMPILAKKKKFILSDEANFDLGRYVNEQNCGIWGAENPLNLVGPEA